MHYDCELIQDLLPLYEEGLCSPASRRAVEAHLSECEGCRALTAPLPIEDPGETPEADRAVRKSMKKVRRRWLASLLAAVLAVPLLLMSVNQVRGRGLCYTNLDDIVTAWRFLHALETENWEKAAGMYDFSCDYESILEALSMDVADWGSTFVRCDLAGYDYAASIGLEREGTIPETPEELYGYLYNLRGSAMVPAALWEELMAIDPGAFSRNGWEYWLNGERYGKIATPWGEYVVSQGRGYDTAYEYAVCFDLIPAAVYEEAKPALEEEALALYTATHADVGWVADLTEEEFTREMARRYAADLGALQGLVSIDGKGFQSAYRLWENDGWHIQFQVALSHRGRSLDAVMGIGVEDGRVQVVSLSYREKVDWLEELNRALYPSAHPGY